MAITFPRDMLETNGRVVFETAQFMLSYSHARAPDRGNRQQVSNLAPDLWVMEYATPKLSYWDAMDTMAWLYSLRGGRRTFKARHPLYTYPSGYRSGFTGLTRAGGGSFDGTCTLSAISTDRSTVTLSGLPAGFTVATHDLLSFPMGTSRCLVAALEAATANGSGVLSVVVEPELPLDATTGVTATFNRPWCLAIIDDKSIRGPLKPGHAEAITFTATQTY